MGNYDLRPCDDGRDSKVITKREKRAYYPLFFLFLLFSLWYGFHTDLWLGTAFTCTWCLIIAGTLTWVVLRLREEKLEELLNEIGD
jgi:hypothetical protein